MGRSRRTGVKKTLSQFGHIELASAHPYSHSANGFGISPVMQEKMSYAGQYDNYSSCNRLGFSFYRDRNGWPTRIAEKSISQVGGKFPTITKWNTSTPMHVRINQLRQVISGWVNYFSIAKGKSMSLPIECCELSFGNNGKPPATEYETWSD
ncbi:group II intron maturase-specific domain-containing protein [Parapedobacter deserti]|uniref:Group II intron maturase-specific domain-containing protein n=1 Tax=Parapedobacter deserti TaxID=1912957 RepID=A0ABV7JX39_9SPHI